MKLQFMLRVVGVGAIASMSACNGDFIEAPRFRPATDATIREQLGPGEDFGVRDTGVADSGRISMDASAMDAGGLDAMVSDTGVVTCDFSNAGDENRPRVVLLGHRFSDTTGVDGTEIRSLTLSPAGQLTDNGVRLDVGGPPARIVFVDSGEFALVLTEGGRLVSVRVGGATDLAVVDAVQLRSASYGGLHVDNGTAFVTGFNSTADSGISTVHIGCDGRLGLDDGAFFDIRLSNSMAFLPGRSRAVLLGGQAVFPPVDNDDTRLLERTVTGWRSVATFDLWSDFVDAGRIAVSPDGRLLAVPNASAASNESQQLMIASITGDTIVQTQRIRMLGDPAEAMFSRDGRTLLVTQAQPGRVAVFTVSGTSVTASTPVAGIGLAVQMAPIERGMLDGLVLIPSVDPNAPPNVAMVRIDGPGRVSDHGQLTLGTGGPQIPGAIAVMR